VAGHLVDGEDREVLVHLDLDLGSARTFDAVAPLSAISARPFTV
jgi:hypothetical protein